MPQIDEILEAQARQLLRLEEREVRAFLRTYHGARRELRERLDSLTRRGLSNRWTTQHTRVALAEMESGIRVLGGRLRGVLGSQAIVRRDVAFRHLHKVIGHFEPQFLGLEAGVNIGAMRRLTASGDLLLHRYSVNRYSAELMERIQAELARGHAARLPRSTVVRRITGLDDSVFSGMEHRGALIDRMENTRAYDASTAAGMEEAGQVLDEPGDRDPLMKKAVEFLDKRSHPFSAALTARSRR